MPEGTWIVTADAPSAVGERLVVIRPTNERFSLGLSELWRQRSLLYVFIWRDIKVRYKQTALGAAWAFLQPFLAMAVFTLVFGRLAKVPSGGIPYPVFVLCGLLPWQFCAHGLNRASTSLVRERYLLTNIYVPRLVLPVSAVLSGLPDLAVAIAVTFATMLHYGMLPTRVMFAAPFFLLLAATITLCVGLFLCALNVRYRDVNFTVPFFTQFWFFLTPIAYPSSLVTSRWRALYGLNPMVGVVDGFRWAMTGSGEVTGVSILVSALAIGILLLLSLLYFQHLDRTFADVV